MTAQTSEPNICCNCGKDISKNSSIKDEYGSNYCLACYPNQATSQHAALCASSPKPPPLPLFQPEALSYATTKTFTDMDLNSRDRKAAAHIAITLGKMGAILAIIAPLIWVIGVTYYIDSRLAERFYASAFIMFVVYAILGGVFLGIGTCIRQGGIVSVIFGLIAGTVAGLANIGLTMLGILGSITAPTSPGLGIAFVSCILGLLNTKLAYHAFRVLFYRGSRGATACTEPSLKDFLRTGEVVARQFPMVVLLSVSILFLLGNFLYAAIAGYQFKQTLTQLPSPPPPPLPVMPTPPTYPAPPAPLKIELMPAHPYEGELYDKYFGLAADKRMIIEDFLDTNWRLGPIRRVQLDTILRDYGRVLTRGHVIERGREMEIISPDFVPIIEAWKKASPEERNGIKSVEMGFLDHRIFFKDDDSVVIIFVDGTGRRKIIFRNRWISNLGCMRWTNVAAERVLHEIQKALPKLTSRQQQAICNFVTQMSFNDQPGQEPWPNINNIHYETDGSFSFTIDGRPCLITKDAQLYDSELLQKIAQHDAAQRQYESYIKETESQYHIAVETTKAAIDAAKAVPPPPILYALNLTSTAPAALLADAAIGVIMAAWLLWIAANFRPGTGDQASILRYFAIIKTASLFASILALSYFSFAWLEASLFRPPFENIVLLGVTSFGLFGFSVYAAVDLPWKLSGYWKN